MSAVRKALEFKGRMLSLTRVRVQTPDLDAIAAQLREFAQQMPAAVQGMPVVIEGESSDFPKLIETLRAVGMQPVGVSDAALAGAARALGLAVLQPDASGGKPIRTSTPEPAAEAAPAPKADAPRKPA